MSNYILLKDLPYVKAGAVYKSDDGSDYITDDIQLFTVDLKWDRLSKEAVENNHEWFEKIELRDWTDELVISFLAYTIKKSTPFQGRYEALKALKDFKKHCSIK